MNLFFVQYRDKIHQNIIKGDCDLIQIEELTGVHHLKIEGEWLIGSRLGTLHFWNLNLNQHIQSLKAHQNGISCLEVQDGKIYTGSFDHTCKVWDLKTAKCLHILEGHTGKILHIKIIEKKLITGSADKTCKIWDLETGTCLYTLGEYDNYIACLDATKDILVALSFRLGVPSRYCCQGWSMHSGKCLYRFEGNGSIPSIKIVDKGFITASSSYNYACGRRCLETGALKEHFPFEFSGINYLEIVDDLVIFGGEHQWKSWNSKTGKIVASEKRLDSSIGTIQINQGKVFTVCYWSSIIIIWDLNTGKYLRTLEIAHLKLFVTGAHYLEIKEGKLIISDTTSCWMGDFVMDYTPKLQR